MHNSPGDQRHHHTAQHPYHHNHRYTIMSISLSNQPVKIHGHSYLIGTELGRGGFGCVYAGTRMPERKDVAIKVVSLATMNPMQSQALATSMLTEISMSKRLKKASHHILEMYDFDFDRERGLSYLVMERGSMDLEQGFRSRGHLNINERKILWRQLVNIATTLYNHNIVHLDIKPANIIVFPNYQIKLADMGIAHKTTEPGGLGMGTPPYTAPEITQATSSSSDSHSTKSDVWSWGAILYRATYDRPPSYTAPSYNPPSGKSLSRDPNLIDVLRHTLTDHSNRVDVPWLSVHPFTLK